MESANSTGRESEFTLVRGMAVVLFLCAPLLYLYVVYSTASHRIPHPQIMILLALLAVAAAEFAMSFVLPNMILRKSPSLKSRKNPNQQYWITRMAMVESIFIFGLAYVFITGDITPVYYFYLLGVLAVVMHWPTRERFDAVAQQLEAK